MYADHSDDLSIDRMGNTLKPVSKDTVVTGIYKDDDEKYSLQNLLRRQEEGDPQ